jgi:hypothetical protein
LFLVRFWAFLGKVGSKTPQKCFCKKSMSKTFSEKIDKNFNVSFPSTFFDFIAFSGVSQRGDLKNTTKKHFTKKSCRKVFPKKSTKKSKTDFFSILFNHVFGRFSVRGVQKHDKKFRGKKSDQSWYFFGPQGTNQPRQGPSFVF